MRHERIEKYMTNTETYYAHRNDNEYETLEQHSDCVFANFEKLVEQKQLHAVFANFAVTFGFITNECKEFFEELIGNMIYFHDFGKIGQNFQCKKMKNSNYKMLENISDTRHSIYSSCFYLDAMITKLIKFVEQQTVSDMVVREFLKIIVLNSYLISKHHGSLDKIELFGDEITKAFYIISENPQLFRGYQNWELDFEIIIENVEASCGEIIKSTKKEATYYVYSNIMFSLLVASDFYATTEYMSDKKIEKFGTIKSANLYRQRFEETKVVKNIRSHAEYFRCGKESPVFALSNINRLRSEMFLETENRLFEEITKNLFYLEAPTGAGKTNMSFNLALRLLERGQQNKIFYIFPFNTLVEQTKAGLEKIFEGMSSQEFDEHIGIINSLSPFVDEKTRDENSTRTEKEYVELLQQRQFLHYPIILTTHVNFFNYLFGTGRETHFPLAQIANSVVILDEVQSYKNGIWTEIIYFLQQYAELLNIKIIIMSATLPNLASLIELEVEPIRLNVNANKYFQNPLFKDRVKFSKMFIDRTKDKNIDEVMPVIEELVKTLLSEGKDKILIEFMLKKNTVAFYQQLKRALPKCEIELITGDDNLIERKRIIDKTRETERLIIVATQVIEAGVDIDMEVGIKQISLFDNEEQFAGRINRSSKNRESGVVYFFAVKEKSVYQNDLRSEERFTVINEAVFEQLSEKRIQEFYTELLKEMKQQRELYNENYNFQQFKNDKVVKLNFKDIEKKMQLITPREEFVFVIAQDDNKKIIMDYWMKLEELGNNKELSYARWRIEVHDIYTKLHQYSYRLQKYNSNENISMSYDGKIGNMYLVLDGGRYFEHGKFIRTELENNLHSSYEII